MLAQFTDISILVVVLISKSEQIPLCGPNFPASAFFQVLLDPSGSGLPAPSAAPRAASAAVSLDNNLFLSVAPLDSFVVLSSLRLKMLEHLLHITFGFDVPLPVWLEVLSSLFVGSALETFDGLPFLNNDSVGFFVDSGGLVVSVFVVEHVILGSTGVFAHAGALALFHPGSPV